jgi:hypothetical protein
MNRRLAAQGIGRTIRPAVFTFTAAVIAVGGWISFAGHANSSVRAGEAEPVVSLFNTTWP